MTWATILTQILHSILRGICFSLDLFVKEVYFAPHFNSAFEKIFNNLKYTFNIFVSPSLILNIL